MKPPPHFLTTTKLSDNLPEALWVPSGSVRVYRGSPLAIVRQMVGRKTSEPFQVREALQGLTRELAKARRVLIQLPWDHPSEEELSLLFLHALLQLRIARPVPVA